MPSQAELNEYIEATTRLKRELSTAKMKLTRIDMFLHEAETALAEPRQGGIGPHARRMALTKVRGARAVIGGTHDPNTA